MATVKFKGGPVKLAGDEIKVGDAAPAVTLAAADLSDKKVGGAQSKAQLLVSVPSLDTPVCATETRKFNQEAGAVEGGEVMVVSMDLPFAAGRFCTTEGVKNLTVCSDFRKKAFAKAYGVLIDEGPLACLTARAVFVVGKDGKVAYKELVEEITAEPNYAAALEAFKKAAA
ncbi:MAG: thiol peroxidase [Elusimicrobiota bacterium]